MAGTSSSYYLGTTPAEGLGNSPRYWYALRRNLDGELFFVRSDQIIDRDAYELNIPGPSIEDFEGFESGVDFLDGLDQTHELVKDNIVYPQYKWDDRSLFYYVDDEGRLVVRINKGFAYPSGISS